MPLKLYRDSQLCEPSTFEEQTLFDYCRIQNIDITMEQRDGQFWLHSDNEKERPIGISLDADLKRHEEYLKKSS